MKIRIDKKITVDVFPIEEPKPKVDKDHSVLIILVEKLPTPPIPLHKLLDPHACYMLQEGPEGWMWIQPTKNATDSICRFFANREKKHPGTMIGKWYWLVDNIVWDDKIETKEVMQNANPKEY